MHFYITSVDITPEMLKINLVCPQDFSKNKALEIKTPEVIAVLPALLDGKINCTYAMQCLEATFIKKYKLNDRLNYSAEQRKKMTVYSRLWNLRGVLFYEGEPFAHLCHYFPNEYEQRNDLVLPKIAKKVVSDEIISAIKKNYTFISRIETAFSQGATKGALSNSRFFGKLPADISRFVGTFLSRKEASIVANVCRNANTMSREEEYANATIFNF